jgi:hypothetical protein
MEKVVQMAPNSTSFGGQYMLKCQSVAGLDRGEFDLTDLLKDRRNRLRRSMRLTM